jgi:hypothetical protein
MLVSVRVLHVFDLDVYTGSGEGFLGGLKVRFLQFGWERFRSRQNLAEMGIALNMAYIGCLPG